MAIPVELVVECTGRARKDTRARESMTMNTTPLRFDFLAGTSSTHQSVTRKIHVHFSTPHSGSRAPFPMEGRSRNGTGTDYRRDNSERIGTPLSCFWCAD